MWARTALAAFTFICQWIYGAQAVPISGVKAIVWLKPNPQFICYWQPHLVDLKTELSTVARGAATSGKNIIIFNPPPKIPAVYLVNYLQFRRINSNNRCQHFSIWPNQAVTEQFRIGERIACIEFFQELLTANIHNNIDCGGLAAVSQDYGECISMGRPLDEIAVSAKPPRLAMGVEINAFCSDVCPQLLFGHCNRNLVACDSGSGSIGRSFNRSFHIDRLLVSSGAQSGGFGEQSRSSLIEKISEKSQKAVETYEKYIGGTYPQWFIAFLLLITFCITWIAIAFDCRIGGLLILAWGWGWTAYAVWDAVFK